MTVNKKLTRSVKKKEFFLVEEETSSTTTESSSNNDELDKDIDKMKIKKHVVLKEQDGAEMLAPKPEIKKPAKKGLTKSKDKEDKESVEPKIDLKTYLEQKQRATKNSLKERAAKERQQQQQPCSKKIGEKNNRYDFFKVAALNDV